MTPEQKQALIQSALAVRQQAYAPYSHYQVGAAILTQDGAIIDGCNVENAAYGAGICAERTAVVKAVSIGQQNFQAIAVATDNGGSPCGICRQVLFEFSPTMQVILVDEAGIVRAEMPLTEFLPFGFGPEKLPAAK